MRGVLAAANHAGIASAPEWAAIFDRLAAEAPDAGSALYALGSPALLAEATAEVVDRLARWGLLGPDRDVLEIGCGSGRFLEALAPQCKSLLGLDLSPGMAARARERCAGLPNVRVLVTEGRDLALVPDASVSVVLAADVFPYLHKAGPEVAARHVAEASRVLRPEGALAIFNYSYRGDLARDRAELAGLSAAHGLTLAIDGARLLRLWDAPAWLLRKPG